MRQMLHGGLVERLARYSMKNKLDVFNSYELKNPCDFIDCDSDSSWDNFQHLVKGDALLYCEIANSSPIGEDGHSLLSKNAVFHRARTYGVLPSDSIHRMCGCLPSTKVYANDVCVDSPSFNKGEFVEAWLMPDEVDGFGIETLCAFAWAKRECVDWSLMNDLVYMSFAITVADETCCKCGKPMGDGYYDQSVDERCCSCHRRSHYDDCRWHTIFNFRKFNGVSLTYVKRL